MLFKQNISLDKLQELDKNSMGGHLGIEYLEIGEDYILAKMPVDHRTRQPFGLLHGGASVVLAENLGSVASVLTLDDLSKQRAVGLEINANHLRSVKEGWVYGKVMPIHIGKKTHVWEIKISNEEGKLVCISRLTIAILTTEN